MTGAIVGIDCCCNNQVYNIVWIVSKSVCEWDCYSLHVLIWLICVFSNCADILVHPQAVMNSLSIGASLLLPPLRERTELLLSLLPQGPQSLNVLSKGQVYI